MTWSRQAPVALLFKMRTNKLASDQNQSSFYPDAMDAGDNFTLIVLIVLAFIWLAATRSHSARCNGLWRIIQNDRRRRSTMRYRGRRSEISQLAAGSKTMQSLIRTVSAVRDNADLSILAQAKFPPAQQRPSSRTEQQASALEETASMEQLTATVRQNTDNARRATGLAKTASETARSKGGRGG